MPGDYRPIPCGIHDVLEDRAVRHAPVRLRWRDAEGAEREATVRIVDIHARAGAEYLRTDGGQEIRLDWLVRVA